MFVSGGGALVEHRSPHPLLPHHTTPTTRGSVQPLEADAGSTLSPGFLFPAFQTASRYPLRAPLTTCLLASLQSHRAVAIRRGSPAKGSGRRCIDAGMLACPCSAQSLVLSWPAEAYGVVSEHGVPPCLDEVGGRAPRCGRAPLCAVLVARLANVTARGETRPGMEDLVWLSVFRTCEDCRRKPPYGVRDELRHVLPTWKSGGSV